MPRGTAVSEQVRELVGNLLTKDEKMTGKELKATVEEEIGGINYTLRTYQSIKKEMQPKINQIRSTGLDKRWHLGALRDHDIPPTAVPVIRLVQQWADNCEDPVTHWSNEPVTIRQALWITRFCEIWEKPKVKEWGKIKPKEEEELINFASYLYHWSLAYARRETICKILDIPFETYELDKAMSEDAYPVVVGHTIVMHFHKDNSFAIDTAEPELLKQMENMEKDGE